MDRREYSRNPQGQPLSSDRVDKAARSGLILVVILEAPKSTLIDLEDVAPAASTVSRRSLDFQNASLQLQHFHSPAYQRHTRHQ